VPSTGRTGTVSLAIRDVHRPIGRLTVHPRRLGHASYVSTTIAGIVILIVSGAATIAAFVGFVWAAKKDGEEDRALQKRLGIRRRTRMGP
jgi:hypothetical protein